MQNKNASATRYSSLNEIKTENVKTSEGGMVVFDRRAARARG